MIEAEKATYPVKRMCELLEVSRLRVLQSGGTSRDRRPVACRSGDAPTLDARVAGISCRLRRRVRRSA